MVFTEKDGRPTGVVMDRSEFEELGEYTTSTPTDPRPGVCWKRKVPVRLIGLHGYSWMLLLQMLNEKEPWVWRFCRHDEFCTDIPLVLTAELAAAFGGSQ